MTRDRLSGRALLVALAAILVVVGATASVAAGAGGSGGIGDIEPVDPSEPTDPTDPTDPTTTPDTQSGVFPVRGRHTYGDGLGAGRDHQGQDLMVKCGKAVVAALPGRVEWIDYDAGGAGHYVVLNGPRGVHDTVYMHLAKAPLVDEGQRVSAGQLLGRVGMTGNTTACHLHFEMWSPKWSAGKPVDPEPYLRRWDRAAAR